MVLICLVHSLSRANNRYANRTSHIDRLSETRKIAVLFGVPKFTSDPTPTPILNFCVPSIKASLRWGNRQTRNGGTIELLSQSVPAFKQCRLTLTSASHGSKLLGLRQRTRRSRFQTKVGEKKKRIKEEENYFGLETSILWNPRCTICRLESDCQSIWST